MQKGLKFKLRESQKLRTNLKVKNSLFCVYSTVHARTYLNLTEVIVGKYVMWSQSERQRRHLAKLFSTLFTQFYCKITCTNLKQNDTIMDT